MIQIRRWLGLIVSLSLLGALAIGLHQQPVATDLTQRADAALKAVGHDWAQVSVTGRDAKLTGSAPDPDSIKDAIAATERVFGIRLVENAASVAPPRPPVASIPLFDILRDGNAVSLSGTVSDDIARKVIIDAVRANAPEIRITDRMAVASGLPPGFATLAAFTAGEAARLDPASAQLKGGALIIQGKAGSFAVHDGVLARLRQPPQGLVVTRQDILAPTARPFLFSVLFDGNSVVLDGFIASEQVRRDLLQRLSQSFPGRAVTDQLRLAEGAPRDAMGFAVFALAQLGKLKSGSARFSDNVLTFEGEPADRASYVAVVNAFSGALPAGLQLASATILLPRVAPYRWTAEKTGTELVVRGYVPSDTVQDIVLGAARRAASGLPLRVEQALALGAPAGFETAVPFLLRQLELLQSGTLSLQDQVLRVEGLAADATIQRRVQMALDAANLSGFTLTHRIAVPPSAVTAPVINPALTPEANLCQQNLKKLVDDQVILFDNGKDTIRPESITVLDQVVAVLRECRISGLVIEGHTDNVGSPADNQLLSEQRAMAVRRYLLDKGIAEALLKTQGFGETMPVGDNASDEGRARNRRIEFTVTP